MARVDNLDHFLTDVADAIRTKAGTSGTIEASAFDTAIANIPSGGSSDIYRATSLANLPQNANEGDIGIVYNKPMINPTASTEFSIVSVPTSYTFSTAITGTSSLTLRPKNGGTYPRVSVSLRASGNSTVQVQLTSSSTTRTTYTYTTSDALTYTLTETSPTPTNTDLGVTMGFTGTTFNENASKLVLVQQIDFASYTYSNNSWSYTNIGADVTSGDMFAPKKAYTNNGLVEGSYDKDSIRDNYIKVSTAEPQEIEGVWLKPSSSITFDKETYLSYTNADISNKIVVDSTEIEGKYKAIPIFDGNYMYYMDTTSDYSSGLVYRLNFLTKEETLMATTSGYRTLNWSKSAICNNNLFVFIANSSTSANALFKIDLTNFTVQQVTNPATNATTKASLFSNKNKTMLFLMPDYDSTSISNDVYYTSTDGVNWTSHSKSGNYLFKYTNNCYFWLDDNNLLTVTSNNGYVGVYNISSDGSTITEVLNGQTNNIVLPLSGNNNLIKINNRILGFNKFFVNELIFDTNYSVAHTKAFAEYELENQNYEATNYNDTIYFVGNYANTKIRTLTSNNVVPDGINYSGELLLQVNAENGTAVKTMYKQYVHLLNARKMPTGSSTTGINIIEQIYIPNSDNSAWVLYKDYTQS